ncbi:hypothetical protein F2Q69_00001006 [Brassica cretica]|uniref:Uncharacterized protein n=1 Tax=Brassica cretica TaxID=69181 RepID=A0A8S9P1D0_BRACR|nr:hypothetical protein F2Q69_00001006 [Brassica cretica]
MAPLVACHSSTTPSSGSITMAFNGTAASSGSGVCWGCTCTLTLPPSFDVGDERGAAEGFGYDGSVLDEDVVAVVSDDEDSAVGNWMG